MQEAKILIIHAYMKQDGVTETEGKMTRLVKSWTIFERFRSAGSGISTILVTCSSVSIQLDRWKPPQKQNGTNAWNHWQSKCIRQAGGLSTGIRSTLGVDACPQPSLLMSATQLIFARSNCASIHQLIEQQQTWRLIIYPMRACIYDSVQESITWHGQI